MSTKCQNWGFTYRSTAQVILVLVLSCANCESNPHKGNSLRLDAKTANPLRTFLTQRRIPPYRTMIVNCQNVDQRSKLGFYIPFNRQGHIGTGPQHCHL